jgi:FkbM family methyltransferase
LPLATILTTAEFLLSDLAHLAIVSIVAILSFSLGFAAHCWRWQDYIRPYVLYLARRTGGCSLSASRTYRSGFARLIETEINLRKRSRLLKTTGDGVEIWATPRGFYWVPGIRSFFYTLAEQEMKIYGSGRFRVRPGDIVLDCGANVGVFTREALSAGAKVVVAVEPVPRKVECLKRTYEPEIRAGRVMIIGKGVWHEEGVLEMSIFKNSVHDSFVLKNRDPDSLGTAQLPVTTIDNLVCELNLSRVDFIKMDLEGADRNALQGAQSTLAKYRPRLSIATEDLPDDYLVVPPIVRQAWPGYRCVGGPCHLESRFQIVPDVLYLY